ncbi:hypothetical protein [Staphylococcus saprophyticus]|uniref:hypothetical protein n=1 Tax=Staphylococcus saprophyticus TaxID=29385 RepID=UPI0013048AB9|nr:hypothetical protein [Staphylococcus saprophyticus]
MQRMKDLEDKENKRVEQHNQLIKKIEESTSTFNQASDDLHVRYKSVANAYLNKINTDNQEQDFQKALDNKFKKIDNNTKTLMNGVIESNKQTRTEIQEYKKTLEGKFQDNDKLVGKYNKTLSKMNQGIFSLFFVVLIVSLVSLVTGPIGDILMLNSYAESIHDQIVQGESIWRYLAYLFYFIPFAILFLILWACTKFINALDNKF